MRNFLSKKEKVDARNKNVSSEVPDRAKLREEMDKKWDMERPDFTSEKAHSMFNNAVLMKSKMVQCQQDINKAYEDVSFWEKNAQDSAKKGDLYESLSYAGIARERRTHVERLEEKCRVLQDKIDEFCERANSIEESYRMEILQLQHSAEDGIEFDDMCQSLQGKVTMETQEKSSESQDVTVPYTEQVVKPDTAKEI